MTTTAVIARTQTDLVQPKARRGRRSISGFMVVIIALLSVGFVLAGTTSQRADAVCIGVNEFDSRGPGLYSDGISGLLGRTDAPSLNSVGGTANLGQPYGNRPVTAYEWWNTGGMAWSMDNRDADCPVMDNVTNKFANWNFNLTKMNTAIALSMFQWASSPNLLDEFIDATEKLVKGTGPNSGLDDLLFLNFLAPVVVLGALWGVWTGLIKKRTTETLQGGLWMLGAATFALIFMANPGAIANAMNSVVGQVTAAVTNAVTTASSSGLSSEDPCYLPNSDEPSVGARMSSCTLWYSLAFTPWAVGQYGQAGASYIDGAPAGQTNVQMGGSKTTSDLRLAQIDAQTLNHDEATTGQYAQLRETKNKQWEAIAEYAKEQPWGNTWAGRDGAASNRVAVSFVSLIASFAAGILVFLISFSIVILQLGMIMLIVTAPLFLLIGVHPGKGRQIALKWAELLLGTAIKRIVLGVALAVVIAFYQIILTTPMSWFAQIALVIAVGVAALIYRKPLTEMFGVISLGSTAGSQIEQGASKITQQASKGKGAVIGAAAGGFAAGKMAEGGIAASTKAAAKGAVSGGTRGSRSGSVVRAATSGSGAGRSTAAKGNTKRARRNPPNCTDCQQPLQMIGVAPNQVARCTNPACPRNGGAGGSSGTPAPAGTGAAAAAGAAAGAAAAGAAAAAASGGSGTGAGRRPQGPEFDSNGETGPYRIQVPEDQRDLVACPSCGQMNWSGAGHCLNPNCEYGDPEWTNPEPDSETPAPRSGRTPPRGIGGARRPQRTSGQNSGGTTRPSGGAS
jgi:TrbL/VirB6 plasmid conjugal transfer protein